MSREAVIPHNRGSHSRGVLHSPSVYTSTVVLVPPISASLLTLVYMGDMIVPQKEGGKKTLPLGGEVVHQPLEGAIVALVTMGSMVYPNVSTT